MAGSKIIGRKADNTRQRIEKLEMGFLTRQNAGKDFRCLACISLAEKRETRTPVKLAEALANQGLRLS